MGRHRSPPHLLGPESFKIRLRGLEGPLRGRPIVTEEGCSLTACPGSPPKGFRSPAATASSGQLPPPSSHLRHGAGLAAAEHPARSPDPGYVQVPRMPGDLRAAPGHRRERRGSFHVRTGVAGKRAPPSLVLVCCMGAIALIESAGSNLGPKKFCLGSFWCISLAPIPCKTEGVKYELHTLPVDAKAVTDGDTITVYVNMVNHPESGNVPQEVRKAAIERIKAHRAKNYQQADALQKIMKDSGYRQVLNMRGEQVLAKKYRIRLRGIDAPESLMPYGKEAKEELVSLVQGKSLKICIYNSDRYGRLVGDVDCNGVSVQEHMLKKGFAWHYTAYDRRMELSKLENQARMSRTGLWALPDPEKPWEWRRKRHIGAM